MKKYIFTLAAIAATLSCAKEAAFDKTADAQETPLPNLVQMTFTANAEQVKAALGESYSVAFAANDEIAVFANGTRYKLTTAAGGANASFTGSCEEAETYYAVYPYSAASSATISDGKINGLTIDTSSAGTGTGTFNSKKAVAAAISTSTTLVFKQLTALLKITVPAEVTNLSEVIIFNRDNGSSNKAGALTGTFSVTPSIDGDPVIDVTTASFQTGFTGPQGSNQAVPAGNYFLPVLPAQLTNKKGIDLKITFLDNFVGRAFNGTGLKLERGKVYNLGTLTRTNEYVYNSFEQQEITGFTGNTNALSVIENPFKTEANPSNYVLKNSVSGTGSTSGYVQVKTDNDYGFIKFPSGVRSNYDVFMFKIYLGTNAYYPRVRRGSNTAAYPYRINGVLLNGDQSVWSANVKTNDWNTLEYRASDIDSGWSNFSSVGVLEIRPLVNWDATNVSGSDETTNNRTVYIDDITFVLK